MAHKIYNIISLEIKKINIIKAVRHFPSRCRESAKAQSADHSIASRHVRADFCSCVLATLACIPILTKGCADSNTVQIRLFPTKVYICGWFVRLSSMYIFLGRCSVILGNSSDKIKIARCITFFSKVLARVHFRLSCGCQQE